MNISNKEEVNSKLDEKLFDILIEDNKGKNLNPRI